MTDKFKGLNCFFKALPIGGVEQIFMKSFISSTNFIVEILFPVFKGIRKLGRWIYPMALASTIIRFVVTCGDGMTGLSGMPEQPRRRRKSGRPHDLPDFLLFIRKHSTNLG